MKNSISIITSLIIALSSIANAQQTGSTQIHQAQPSLGPVFHNEAPHCALYEQPNGDTYITYDYGRTWQVYAKGSGSLPPGVHSLPVLFPYDRTFIKYDTKYVSHDGGRTFWKVSGSINTALSTASVESIPETSSSTAHILSVVPNPTTGPLILTLNVPNPVTVVITICDVSGKVVKAAFNGPMSGGSVETQIDEGSLPSGAYILRVATNSSAETWNFIVEH